MNNLIKNNSFSEKFAKFISYLFIPPFFNLFTFSFFAFQIENSPINIVFIILNSFIFGVVIPIMFFYFLRKKRLISDNNSVNKEERNIPYLIYIFISLFAIPPLLFIKCDFFFVILWIIFALLNFILLVINKFWKISAHTMGASVAFGVFYFMNSIIAYPIILLCVLISWSRIKLNIHTKLQLFAGSILGFCFSYLVLFLSN